MGEIDDDNKEENVKHEKPLFFVFVVAKFFSYRMKMEGSVVEFLYQKKICIKNHIIKKKEMRKWHASDFVHHFYYSVFFVV